jgi:hypothetical protein
MNNIIFEFWNVSQLIQISDSTIDRQMLIDSVELISMAKINFVPAFVNIKSKDTFSRIDIIILVVLISFRKVGTIMGKSF